MKFPPFSVRPHKTLFGGTRTDIVVVEILLDSGLPSNYKLSDFVHLTLPHVTLEDLQLMVEYQAIYVCHFQLPLSSIEGMRRYRRQQARRMERLARGTSGDGIISPDAPLLTRRIERLPLDQCQLPKATKNVRFHLKPLRFHIVPLLKWVNRILWENQWFIVVDKPAGLPCEPVASNSIECLHQQVNKYLNVDYIQPLHRIDLWSSGLVCLAKTHRSIKLFNSLQRDRKIQKFYRLLASRPAQNSIPLSILFGFAKDQSHGQIVHWMPTGKQISYKVIQIKQY